MELTNKQKSMITLMGYQDANDFLNNYPYRYEYLFEKPFESWVEKDNVVFTGILSSAFKTFRFGRNQSATNFSVVSLGHNIPVVIYNRPFLRAFHYENGITVVGTVGEKGKIIAKSVTNKSIEDVVGIHPIYRLKSGVKNYEVIRLISKILKSITVENIIPSSLIEQYRLLDRNDAITKMHQPQSCEDIEQALRTLKYEEFLIYHLSVAINQSDFALGQPKHIEPLFLEQLTSNLPYTLTDSQIEAYKAIAIDLASNSQMHRLLQGDVGSGKTIVAFLSAVVAIRAGYQAVFLVPTEILMRQHEAKFRNLFPEIEVVTLFQGSDDREQVLNELTQNKNLMIFGTHALFQNDVIYSNLGLVIIDEQHRFGVEQRQRMIAKGDKADILMLSATPIPRTLASSLFFDLSVSTIDGYPVGRKDIVTTWVHENSIRSILPDINQKLEQHEQVYVVCGAIEDNEREGVKNVTELTQVLKGVFSHNVVAMLHGKMSRDEKNRVMKEFENGFIDILVCTTVIEVGIDVHNANTMIIYNAELFGLATLHQLRGRVGRGAKQGYCYLLSGHKSEETTLRMEALEHNTDGFALSMIDMRLRGFGDVLGDRQSGLPNFIVGDLEKDAKILKQAKIDAGVIMADRDNYAYSKILTKAGNIDYFKSI